MKIICTNIFRGETGAVRREAYTAAWAKILPRVIEDDEKIANDTSV